MQTYRGPLSAAQSGMAFLRRGSLPRPKTHRADAAIGQRPLPEFLHSSGRCGGYEPAIRGVDGVGGQHFRVLGHFLTHQGDQIQAGRAFCMPPPLRQPCAGLSAPGSEGKSARSAPKRCRPPLPARVVRARPSRSSTEPARHRAYPLPRGDSPLTVVRGNFGWWRRTPVRAVG